MAMPAPLATESLLLDAAMAGDGPGRKLVVVGDRGHILVSLASAPGLLSKEDVPGAPEDADTAIMAMGTWRQVAVPTSVMLTGIAAPGGNRMWAVGHDAVILHSADGGETWARQYSDPERQAPLLDVWFENAATGWAVGAYGLALHTSDGGKTWEKREIDDQERHLYAVTAGADGALYVAGESGALFRSADKGETWDELASPYKGSFFGLLALREGPLLVFGMRGQLYRSADQGKSWRQVETKTVASLTAAWEGEDGRVVLVGVGGTVLDSNDGGQSVTARNRPGRRAFAGVIEARAGNFLAVGVRGVEPLNLPGGMRLPGPQRVIEMPDAPAGPAGAAAPPGPAGAAAPPGAPR
jgi:photosystem II stability/assembly factor-like uncharacterized protein